MADVNDNAPVMSDKRIDVSFREDIKIGSKLFQVYATDRDDPVNYGKVRFRLENEQSYYKINADTGEVFLQAMFDYETARSDEVSDVKPIHHLRLWESENSNHQKSSQINQKLTISSRSLCSPGLIFLL